MRFRAEVEATSRQSRHLFQFSFLAEVCPCHGLQARNVHLKAVNLAVTPVR